MGAHSEYVPPLSLRPEFHVTLKRSAAGAEIELRSCTYEGVADAQHRAVQENRIKLDANPLRVPLSMSPALREALERAERAARQLDAA